jgi:hypothetical protein
MGPHQVNFINYVKQNYPHHFKNCDVIDFGSGDINGNNRAFFSESNYAGVDVFPGPNVDIVCKCHELNVIPGSIDTIISTEMLEHDPFWKESLLHMYECLKNEGLLLVTCATTGRPEHGTRRTSPGDSFATRGNLFEFSDYYQNINQIDVMEVFSKLTFKKLQFFTKEFNNEGVDLFFYGIK